MIVLPEIDAAERSHDGQREHLTLRFALPASTRYFEGHFPEVPLLPGVVQIGWAVEFGRQYFELPARFLGGAEGAEVLVGVDLVAQLQHDELHHDRIVQEAEPRHVVGNQVFRFAEVGERIQDALGFLFRELPRGRHQPAPVGADEVGELAVPLSAAQHDDLMLLQRICVAAGLHEGAVLLLA